MQKTFSITFKGTDGGSFAFVDLTLDNKIVGLKSTNGGVTWTNSSFTVDYTPPLHVRLACGALKGTTWDIVIKEVGAAAACYQDNGVTGDVPGDDEPNISIRETDTNC